MKNWSIFEPQIEKHIYSGKSQPPFVLYLLLFFCHSSWPLLSPCFPNISVVYLQPLSGEFFSFVFSHNIVDLLPFSEIFKVWAPTQTSCNILYLHWFLSYLNYNFSKFCRQPSEDLNFSSIWSNNVRIFCLKRASNLYERPHLFLAWIR